MCMEFVVRPVPYRYLPNGYGTAERAYYLKQKKQG